MSDTNNATIVYTDPSGLSIQVMFSDSFSGYIQVIPFNECGSVTPRTDVFCCKTFIQGTLEVSTRPLSLGCCFGGPDQLCILEDSLGNDSIVVTYSIPEIVGALFYEWTVSDSSHMRIIANDSSTVQVVIKKGFESGQVCVSYEGLCGKSDTSCYGIFEGLQVSEIFGPGNNICSLMGSWVTYSVSDIASNVPIAYQWSVPDGVTMQPSVGNTVSVMFTDTFEGGKICVNVSNNVMLMIPAEVS